MSRYGMFLNGITAPLSSPCTKCAPERLNTSQIRSRVVVVIDLPASISCQCLAEKRNEIHALLAIAVALSAGRGFDYASTFSIHWHKFSRLGL